MIPYCEMSRAMLLRELSWLDPLVIELSASKFRTPELWLLSKRDGATVETGSDVAGAASSHYVVAQFHDLSSDRRHWKVPVEKAPPLTRSGLKPTDIVGCCRLLRPWWPDYRRRRTGTGSDRGRPGPRGGRTAAWLERRLREDREE